MLETSRAARNATSAPRVRVQYASRFGDARARRLQTAGQKLPGGFTTLLYQYDSVVRRAVEIVTAVS